MVRGGSGDETQESIDLHERELFLREGSWIQMYA